MIQKTLGARLQAVFSRARPIRAELLVLAVFIFSPSHAWASGGNEHRSATYGTAAPTRASSPESTPKTKAVCSGMSCQYIQANEKLSLQALYAIQKLQRIDQAIDANRENEARIALGGFCRDSSEALDACFKRYQAFQRVALLEIRQAIGKNEDTIAYLVHGRKIDGSIEGEGVAFGQEADRAPRIPDVTTLSELEAAYLQGKLKPRSGRYSANDIRKWSQELVISNPLARTLEFKKETVDGGAGNGEKSSYRLYMTERDSDGAAKSDAATAASYQEAQKAIVEYSKDQGIDTFELKVHTPGEIKKRDKNDISYEAFTEARSIMNSKIEKDLKGEGAVGRSSPGRSVAADPKASKTANGSDDGRDSPSGAATKEVKVNSTARRPSGNYRRFGDDEKIALPPESKDSRYIRYDLHDLMKDIDQSTR